MTIRYRCLAVGSSSPSKDAAGYIMKLPKAERDLEALQTAIGCLIGAAEGRDLMLSRIGVLVL